MKKNYFGYIFNLFVFIFSFSLFCGVLVSVFSVLSLTKKKRNSEPHDFRYFAFDQSTNESSVGILSKNYILVDDEFISYKTDSGGNVLISNFGTEQYHCTGSCVCEDEEINRRVSGVIVSKGVSYLLASVSFLVAYNRAKDYFNEECLKVFSDSCLSIVSSEVDNCERISSQETSAESEVRNDFRRYFCKGHCLTKKFRKESANKIAVDFGCENLKTEGEVEIDMTHVKQMKKTVFAIAKFQKEYIVPFCKRSSGYTFWVENSSKLPRRYLCVGSRNHLLNPSIHCIQTYPKSIGSGNLKYWKDFQTEEKPIGEKTR